MKTIQETLLEALYLALPFVEDCQNDPCYKPGAVDRALKTILGAIKAATTGDKTP